MAKQQPKKDSDAKRVNFDNERESKFDKTYEKRPSKNRQQRRKEQKHEKRQSNPSDVKTEKEGNNEVAWYSKNQELVKAAGSLPFAEILGQSLSPDTYSNAVPGIMRIEYIPIFSGGENTASKDAMRQCFDSMYSYLVHANSRNYNYEPVDLGILTIAGFNVFSAIAHVIRAYGIARYYAESSLYSPDSLLATMGFNYKDFRANLGKIWFDINFLIDRTKQIWIPNTMPLLQRHFWMNSNIFQDSEVGAASQMYLFVPQCFYEYQPITGGTGGGLVKSTYDVAINEGGSVHSRAEFTTRAAWKWEIWYDMIMHMIDTLVKDEDRGVIYGDILQAFGKDKIFALPSISADYTVVPVFNAEALTQIENLTMMQDLEIKWYQQNPNKPSLLLPVYKYNSSTIATASTKATGKYFAPSKVILNFHQQEQPTPEQIMVATRLTTCGTMLKTVTTTDGSVTVQSTGSVNLPSTADKVQAVPYATGTEVVTGLFIMKEPLSMTYNYIGYQLTYAYANELTSGAGIYPTTWYADILPLMAFDWHPFLYSLLSDAKLDTKPIIGDWTYGLIPAGDYENYTRVSPRELEKLHYVATWSLYDIPIV